MFTLPFYVDAPPSKYRAGHRQRRAKRALRNRVQAELERRGASPLLPHPSLVLILAEAA